MALLIFLTDKTWTFSKAFTLKMFRNFLNYIKPKINYIPIASDLQTDASFEIGNSCILYFLPLRRSEYNLHEYYAALDVEIIFAYF